MKKCFIALMLSAVLVVGTAAAGLAAMGEGTVKANKGVDLTLFGSNRVIPAYYRNFDFDDDANDGAILTEGGFGAGYFVRNELRLGFKGTGENWGFQVILEDDIHMTKDNGDRNTYSGYGASPGTKSGSDFGSEFSVERSKFWYNFGGVTFTVGWDVKFADIKTGGLVYGDDHPFMSLTGGDKTLNWDLTMLLVNDTDDIDDAVSGRAPNDFDWYVYMAKVNYTFASGDTNKFTVSPFVALSDLGAAYTGFDAQTWYLGLEGYGSFGIFQPSFEIAYANGEIKDGFVADGSDVDVDSWAAFAGLTLALSPQFNPYITCTYQQGDDDPTDDDAEGFVGITNIARYTPYGMDNSIIYEHFGGAEGFGAPLYALSTERSTKGNVYGGIGNAGSGNNPGLLFFAAGAKGKIQKASYNVRACYLQYDEEDALAVGIDDEIGWTVDGQVKYPLSANFYTVFTASYFVAGDGIEDYNEARLGDAYDSEDAWLTALELGWTW
ncbi:MAG: hypothetical protein JW781_11240 [Deltaproteobacteria bacterium]|nr:hypothetical protein [Candidatus Anaeroferrophillacea bacterium]